MDHFGHVLCTIQEVRFDYLKQNYCELRLTAVHKNSVNGIFTFSV